MTNLQAYRGAAKRRGIMLAVALGLGLPALGLAAARTAPPSDSVPETSRVIDAAVRHQRIPLATGVELHVAEVGPVDGTPIVFLHGFTDSWYSWSLMMDHLPPGVRAIIPTQRGHGDSQRPACCYDVRDFAADVDALLAALGIDRAHIVGHSMGGVIAQRVAISYPERVDCLVIVSSAADVRNADVVEFHEVVRQLADPVDVAFIREFQSGTAALPLPAAFLDSVISESAKLPARIWRDVLGGLVAPEASHDISLIRAPTLVVWGEKDAFFGRADQDRMVRGITGARLLSYPMAAHAPNWEMPDILARDLWAFLGVAR